MIYKVFVSPVEEVASGNTVVKALRMDVPKEERSPANGFEPSRFPIVETPRNISTIKAAFEEEMMTPPPIGQQTVSCSTD